LKEKRPKLLKCPNGHYTLKEQCPSCGLNTFNPEPPKYSSIDKYGEERRTALYK
jgi:rRNA maturation protein Nop10